MHSNGFPVSTGAFQTNFAGGGFDMGIIKLSPNGANRIYATYIGGSGAEQPHSLFVDGNGSLGLRAEPIRLFQDQLIPQNRQPWNDLEHRGYDIVVTKPQSGW